MIVSQIREKQEGKKTRPCVVKQSQESQGWNPRAPVYAGKITSRKREMEAGSKKGCCSSSDLLHAEWHILVGLFTKFNSLCMIHNLFRISPQ